MKTSKKLALTLGLAASLMAVSPMIAFADTTANTQATQHNWDRDHNNDDNHGDNNHNNNDHDRNNRYRNNRNSWFSNRWNWGARPVTIRGIIQNVFGANLTVSDRSGRIYNVNAAGARVSCSHGPCIEGLQNGDEIIVNGSFFAGAIRANTIIDLL